MSAAFTPSEGPDWEMRGVVIHDADGSIVRMVKCRRDHLAQNVGAEHVAAAIEYDPAEIQPGHHSHRVDLGTRMIVRREPEPPAAPDPAHAVRDAILAKWPIEAQIEALTESAAGRPDKLGALLADIETLKSA